MEALDKFVGQIIYDFIIVLANAWAKLYLKAMLFYSIEFRVDAACSGRE